MVRQSFHLSPVLVGLIYAPFVLFVHSLNAAPIDQDALQLIVKEHQRVALVSRYCSGNITDSDLKLFAARSVNQHYLAVTGSPHTFAIKIPADPDPQATEVMELMKAMPENLRNQEFLKFVIQIDMNLLREMQHYESSTDPNVINWTKKSEKDLNDELIRANDKYDAITKTTK